MPQPILLCNTKDMPRKRWLECRKHGPNGDIPFTLGGSDIATVFGINPWKTPLELFMEKRDLLAPNEDENAKQKNLGHLLEPVVADVFATETGSEIIEDYGMYQHAEYPFAIADIDYLYRQGTTEGVLECKSTTYHKAGDYQNGCTPIHYELQVRFYLEVRQYETGELACLWGNNPDTDFVHRTIRYDKHISQEILEGAKEFIHRLENNDPPPMDGVPSKLAIKALNRIYDNVKDSPPVEFSSAHEPALRKIVELQKQKMELKKKADLLAQSIEELSVPFRELLKDNAHGKLAVSNGSIFVDFTQQSKRIVDTKKLQKEYPDIYKEVQKTSVSRPFKVRCYEANRKTGVR